MSEVVSYPYVGPPKVRCSAHRKNGDQCKRWAIVGGNVCPVHGGSAGHVKRKAAARIEASLDRAAIAIVRLMENADTPPAVKLAAARDLLDRGNLTGKQIVQVEGSAPWQVLLQKIIVRPTAEELSDQPVVEVEWLTESSAAGLGAGVPHLDAARPIRRNGRATFRR